MSKSKPRATFPFPPVGEGGASRSEAAGEGFEPQRAHHLPIAKRLRKFAKSMRRRPTDAEVAMWRLLRDRRLAKFKFRRQVPFKNYILHFVCFSDRWIIEIDGSQHLDSKPDAHREALLVAEGFKIARYWNNDVLQTPSSVLEDIFSKLVER